MDDPVRSLVMAIQLGHDYNRNCEALFKRFEWQVERLFLRHGFTKDESADLTMDTFVRVFDGIGDFHHESSFARWLFEIASNIWRNELRRRGTAKRDALEEPIEDARVESLPSTVSGPLEGILNLERRASLHKAITQLPPQMRQCLLLRLQGLKYHEIAVVMRVSIQTVRSHLHQAQKRLQTHLSEPPNPPASELEVPHEAIAQLPPQMRRCLRLRLQGLKYREIATEMQISIQTVKAHLHQAQKRLQAHPTGAPPAPPGR